MASLAVPLSQRPLSERAFVAMNRRAVDAGRAPIVRLDEDIGALDAATGSRRRSKDALRQLGRDGRVRRVRRGVYLLETPTGSTSAPLLPLIDAITPRPYLVTAGRALVEFSLSDQHFFRTVVLTPRRLDNWAWRGEEVRYAVVAPERIWGLYTPNGPSVAVPERSILDCLANPRWGVSVPQAAEALDRGLPLPGKPGRIDVLNLARTTERYGSAAVARRLGYLVELLRGPAIAEPFLALRGGSHKHVLLGPSGPDQGTSSARWGLRINVDPDALVAHRIIG